MPADQRPAEIAWVIGRPWQRRGFAGRAAQLLVNDLRARGVAQIIAHIHPDHEASQRIAERLGMTPSDVVVEGETRWTGPLV
ncbi:MAG: GNAT family N-acetyltransferase [Brachybacterium sp.]